jgi:hypothetical protein
MVWSLILTIHTRSQLFVRGIGLGQTGCSVLKCRLIEGVTSENGQASLTWFLRNIFQEKFPTGAKRNINSH